MDEGRNSDDIALYSYTAGIIDGEGYIGIYRHTKHCKGKTYTFSSLRVAVGTTDEWLPQFLKFHYGGSIYQNHAETARHKAQWCWSLHADSTAKFLSTILPYLHIKRSQAELALSWQKRKQQQRGYNVLDDADMALMAAYNKKGPKEVCYGNQWYL